MNKIKYSLALFPLLLYSCSYLPDDVSYDETLKLVETTEYIKLTPKTGTVSNALIFVPGGLVDPHAYISLMQRIAGSGIQVYILKMSANLAILEINKAMKIKEQSDPNADNWYIAGHSLGGISAQAVVYNNPESFDGLILLGAYPAENYSLSDWQGNVLSVYAENDKLSSVEEIEDGKIHLPPANSLDSLNQPETLSFEQPTAIYYMIEGGNHSQFGAYGFQKGDGEADISRDEQHRQITEAITKFIDYDANK